MKSSFASLLCLAASAQAHYTFPAFIHGTTATPEWQYVRQWTGYISNGPVTDVSLVDIRCNVGGANKSAPGILTVAAGDKVGFTAAPDIYHPGPLLAYMAKVPAGKTAAVTPCGHTFDFTCTQQRLFNERDSRGLPRFNDEDEISSNEYNDGYEKTRKVLDETFKNYIGFSGLKHGVRQLELTLDPLRVENSGGRKSVLMEERIELQKSQNFLDLDIEAHIAAEYKSRETLTLYEFCPIGFDALSFHERDSDKNLETLEGVYEFFQKAIERLSFIVYKAFPPELCSVCKESNRNSNFLVSKEESEDQHESMKVDRETEVPGALRNEERRQAHETCPVCRVSITELRHPESGLRTLYDSRPSSPLGTPVPNSLLGSPVPELNDFVYSYMTRDEQNKIRAERFQAELALGIGQRFMRSCDLLNICFDAAPYLIVVRQTLDLRVSQNRFGTEAELANKKWIAYYDAGSSAAQDIWKKRPQRELDCILKKYLRTCQEVFQAELILYLNRVDNSHRRIAADFDERLTVVTSKDFPNCRTEDLEDGKGAELMVEKTLTLNEYCSVPGDDLNFDERDPPEALAILSQVQDQVRGAIELFLRANFPVTVSEGNMQLDLEKTNLLEASPRRRCCICNGRHRSGDCLLPAEQSRDEPDEQQERAFPFIF
ncbi:hypothetical protein G7Y89_g5012 [Cudoniella acicularis]|uniref:lytic cellulose monooxygenase (C4-dehydrogenating) n=1 Tax=Cudoniella acicularis TaxID=354080 RepID=A0A8H4RPT1_9HELO|nr:hypothetical protein G7Y89_g5012 [Cudoniella acicularis]